jgi:hypothetical protein
MIIVHFPFILYEYNEDVSTNDVRKKEDNIMAHEIPHNTLKETERVYANTVDKYYHQKIDCMLMLPTVYTENQAGQASRSGLKPCKRCIH